MFDKQSKNVSVEVDAAEQAEWEARQAAEEYAAFLADTMMDDDMDGGRRSDADGRL